MNIFHIYLPGRIHLVSIVLVGVALLMTWLCQAGREPKMRLILSFLSVVLGHFVYEDIFIQLMGLHGRGTEAWGIYFFCTMILIYFGILLHKRSEFITWSYATPFGLFILSVLFGAMMFTGWFTDLQIWYLGGDFDPHNLSWACSKLIGFLLFNPQVTTE